MSTNKSTQPPKTVKNVKKDSPSEKSDYYIVESNTKAGGIDIVCPEHYQERKNDKKLQEENGTLATSQVPHTTNSNMNNGDDKKPGFFNTPTMLKIRKVTTAIIASSLLLGMCTIGIVKSRKEVMQEYRGLTNGADKRQFIKSELVSVFHVLFLAAMLSCLVYSILIYNTPMLAICVLILYINTAFVVRSCPITAWQNNIRSKINLPPVNYLKRYFGLNLKQLKVTSVTPPTSTSVLPAYVPAYVPANVPAYVPANVPVSSPLKLPAA